VSDNLAIYDVTLRDGAQGAGVKFSSEDQLRIIRALDRFGVSYIEAGQPGSNPKAIALFQRLRDLELEHATITAFGSTRHPKSFPENDVNLARLLDAGTEVVAIFAKCSPVHVHEVLGIGLDENLAIIEESVAYLVAQGRTVFLDAEHFYDGYALDAEYALTALERGRAAGASVLVLCDTNGGRLPQEVADTTRAVRRRLPEAALGIHAHNDIGCAVANTLAAVAEGALQVQGTINGYGERTGNANLSTVVPAVQLKLGRPVVSPDQLASITRLSHLVAELANMAPRDCDPFVGRDAFTHKGGMHADALRKHKPSYEHIDPGLVGNRSRVLVSELSGRSSLLQKAAQWGITLDRDNPQTQLILERVKTLESEGFEFEAADASLELLLRRAGGAFRPFFTLQGFHVSVTRHGVDEPTFSVAGVTLGLPDGTRMHTSAEGHGPVDALNNALRKALEDTYPELKEVHLEDYKVRILDAQAATRAKTRVLIESSDDENSWDTVGVSENIITASYEALLDSIEYKLLQTRGPRDAGGCPTPN